jgi:hypothetical protein
MHIFMNFLKDFHLKDKTTHPYFIQAEDIIIFSLKFKEENLDNSFYKDIIFFKIFYSN